MTEASPSSETRPVMQFDDLDQQREAASLGMWTFLVTEVLFFGAMFTGYTVYRIAYPGAFHEASHHLYMWIGAANTFILLTSSLTMALAVHAAATAQHRATVIYLASTLGLGLLFLTIKAVEYYLDYHDHLVPGVAFDPERFRDPSHAALFYVFYFIMTGVHAVHMIIGVSVVSVVMMMAWRRKFTPDNHNAVENVGLYWHFVDIVWIFLLPLLYLIGL